MATHVKVIAVLFVLFGIFGLVGAFFSSVILGVLAGMAGASGNEGAPVGAAILGLTGIALTTILLVLSIPSLVAAYGLLMLRPWARILAIILAVLSLLRFPIGTVFGVYVLVILFRKDAEALFVARP
jgi:hypothetical protein